MTAREDFADAERRLFAVYGLDCESHGLALEDPALSIGVRESGAGDPYSYSGRPLRAHADAQLTSVLDALALDRAVLVGTSLGECGRSAWRSMHRSEWPPWSASACPRWRCQGPGRSFLHPADDPAIGRRAAELIPEGRLDVVPGKHAPFLDDPQRCAALITDAVARGRQR